MRTGRAICLLVIFFIVISIVYVHNEQYSIRQPLDVSSKEYYSSGPIGYFKEKVRQHWGSDSTHYRTPGKVIMGKMGNETLRYVIFFFFYLFYLRPLPSPFHLLSISYIGTLQLIKENLSLSFFFF